MSQKFQISEALKALAPEITKEDRAAFIKIHGRSKSTISLYLNGNVYDVNTGLKMLSFFSRRIIKRQELIEGSIAK